MADDSTTQRKRVFAYCRYSSEGQSRYSIEAQHDEILLRARTERWEAEWITWWDEPARSAFVEDPRERPVWHEMMAAARAGECDVVIVYDVSRFSRLAHVALGAANDIIKIGAQFISCTEVALDSTTMVGWNALGYAAVSAQAFAIQLGERSKRGHAQRAKAGLHLGLPCFGYRLQDDRDASQLPCVPDLRTDMREGEGAAAGRISPYAALQELHRYLLIGHTNAEGAAYLNSLSPTGTWPFFRAEGETESERALTAWTVDKIRRNVYYRPYKPNDDRGTVTHNDVEYRGQHQAACTWDEWQTMQEVARSRRRGWHTNHARISVPFESEFRAALCCADCGSRLWVLRARARYHATDRYIERYQCPAKERGIACASAGRYIHSNEMRALWIEWLRAHPLPGDVEERVRQHVVWLSKHQQAAAGMRGKEDVSKIIAEKELWEQRRARAMTAYLVDIKIDEHEWRRLVSRADKEITRLNHASRNAEQVTIRLLDAARIMSDAASAWGAMNTQERQMAAQLMIAEKGIHVQCLGYRGRYYRVQAPEAKGPSGRIVDVTLREPFRDLLAVMNGELVSELVSEEVAG